MTLLAATLALVCVSADDSGARTGLLGAGLGVEGPYVGVMTGFGSRSDMGAGYSLGGALSWDATKMLSLRTLVAVGQTFGARAGVSFLDGDERVVRRQNAEWFGTMFSLGAAYMFTDEERAWTPYLGIDAGGQYAGYEYRFNRELASKLESAEVTAVDPDCGGEACKSELHTSYGLGWHAGARAGMRFTMASWLATLLEVAMVYLPAQATTVSQTLNARKARSVAEDLWLVRATFSARLGL